MAIPLKVGIYNYVLQLSSFQEHQEGECSLFFRFGKGITFSIAHQ